MRSAAVDPDRTRAAGRGTARARRRAEPWRAPLAAAGLITAAAHIPVTGEHLEEAAYIGVLFVALEVVSVVLAIAVLVRPVRAVYLAFAAVGALAVLALVISRTVGLPLIADDIGNWTEPLAVVSAAAEAVMALGGAVAAVGMRSRSTRSARLGLIAGVVILVLGSIATGVAASAAPADDGHDTGGTHMGGMRMEGMG